MWSNARKAILESSQESSIYIGCDSLVHGTKADYSIVVVIHKDSRHGCKIFHNHITLPDYGQMETGLYREVGLSLEAFEAIKDAIGDRKLELHLDVNPDKKFASSSVASQALGWVKGMGIEAKIKPFGFAASYAADHCVRRKSLFSN